MNPTFSPIFGPAGLGGGGGGSTTGGGATSTWGGSSLTSGWGGSGGGLMTTMGSTGAALGAGGGGASLTATSGCSLQSSSSRYSALILSSELDGTLAASMPSDLALARITLFSRPSFFEMSYIRTGINFFLQKTAPVTVPAQTVTGGIHQATAVADSFPPNCIFRLSASARTAFKMSAACSPICGMLLKSLSSADNKSSSRVKPACTRA